MITYSYKDKEYHSYNDIPFELNKEKKFDDFVFDLIQDEFSKLEYRMSIKDKCLLITFSENDREIKVSKINYDGVVIADWKSNTNDSSCIWTFLYSIQMFRRMFSNFEGKIREVMGI